MEKYFHRCRKLDEPSAYIRTETLRYTLNYIRNSGEFWHEAILDNLLGFLTQKQVESITEKFRRIYARPSSRAASLDFKSLYADLLIYLTGNSAKTEVVRLLQEILTLCEQALASNAARIGMPAKGLFTSRLEELKNIFALSAKEIEVLKVIYFYNDSTPFRNMCLRAEINMEDRFGKKNVMENIKRFTDLPEQPIKKALRHGGSLKKYGLIENDFRMVAQISSFLNGLSEKPLTDNFYRKYSGKSVALDEHINISQHIEVLETLIRNCGYKDHVNILLYGTPGTGKTEFCRSLSRHLCRDIYEVNTASPDERTCTGTRFRLTALHACLNTVKLGKSIIMIDEADEILNGGSISSALFGGSLRNAEKDILNDYIDNNPGIYFWITNHYKNIEESTRRRFDYSIEFKKLTVQQRVRIWKSCIHKYGLDNDFDSCEIAMLAPKYDINTGGIELAVRNYKRFTKGMKQQKKHKDKNEIIAKILNTHISLLSEGRKKNDSPKPISCYSIKGLSIKGSIPLNQSLSILKAFSERDYSIDRNLDDLRNMNALLFGPPGTGKTEFAKYIAVETGKRLLSKKGSDLLSMWVGGTEHNIRDAFMEAETEGSILFIDEADGLFTERADARIKRWEITQVNELLSNMEEFKGILICATNFKKNMDAASIRRFNIKIEFDYLELEGKKIFFNRFLGDLSRKELNKHELEILGNIDFLTPGDFKIVRQKNMFLPRNKVSNLSILNELQIEVSYKNTLDLERIGFRHSAADM